MQVHQLREALDQHDADPDAVLRLLQAKRRSRSPLRATVTQSPVVDGQVIFGGCWNPREIGGKTFHGPLTEIPGSGTYERAAAPASPPCR